MDACPGGQAVQYRKRGEVSGTKSGSAQSKGGVWGGSWYTEVDEDDSENS